MTAARGMSLAMAIIAQQDFQSYDDKVYRSADKKQYLFSEVIQDFKIKANNAPLQQCIAEGLLIECKRLHMTDLLNNWQKKSADRQKLYKRWLERADKPPKRTRILDRLPEFHAEAFEKIDCLQCANCCKSFSPRFKMPDIKRISRHLQLKESEFIERYLRIDEEGDYVVRSTPCPFLGADNKCGIYEVRPSDCERFPYTNEDVLVKRPVLTQKNSTFCPIVYFVLEKLMAAVE